MAYSILAHRNASEVIRLITQLQTERLTIGSLDSILNLVEPKKTSNAFCVHIDAKSDPTYQLVKEYSRCVDNVIVLDNRVDIIYAGYSYGFE